MRLPGSPRSCSTVSSRAQSDASTIAGLFGGRLRLFDGVAAELIPQRGEEPLGERIGLARAVAREHGRRERGQRDGAVDALVQRPAALAGVFDERLDSG